MVDAHKALRDATTTIHEELHEHPAFRGLLNGSISPECYTDLMVQFYRFYKGLDPLICAALRRGRSGIHEFEYQSRAPFFADDLTSMGVNLISQYPAGIIRPHLPSYHSMAALAGALYVIEGSALGGAMMNRGLDKVQSPERVLGRSYWEWCARFGKQRWKSALHFIASTVIDDIDVRESLKAAQSTFQSLSEWLEPVANRVDVVEPVAATG